jgi:hypothetical protein
LFANESAGIASLAAVCHAAGVVASYEEFAAKHRTQHVEPFNRWCAVVGNSMVPVAVVTALTGRLRAGAAIFALANTIVVAGHVVEGNLPRATRDLLRHPIWGVRADVAVAIATIRDLMR